MFDKIDILDLKQKKDQKMRNTETIDKIFGSWSKSVTFNKFLEFTQLHENKIRKSHSSGHNIFNFLETSL